MEYAKKKDIIIEVNEKDNNGYFPLLCAVEKKKMILEKLNHF